MNEEFRNALAEKYNLTLKEAPLVLNGGLLHKVYVLRTNKGDYAMKLLNPSVMQRENAMANFAEAERLETLLEKKDVPLLPALTVGGKKMQEIDGQYFYLYTYFSGKILEPKEVTEYHSRKMGTTLAQIHALERRPENEPPAGTDTDWDFLLAKAEFKNPALYELLNERIDVIKEYAKAENEALKKLPPVSTVCHNDLDRKNVLWKGRDFYVIDLECLAHGSPVRELLITALAWSGMDECDFKPKFFHSFMEGYYNADGILPLDWETLCACGFGKLGWLEYSLKRALCDDGFSESDAVQGEKQAAETIKQLVYYSSVRDVILDECRNINT